MGVETVRMSSKGQIVIPLDVREELQADEGTIFAVVSSKDTIVLKKIAMPSKDELIKNLKAFAMKGRKRAELLGIKESDVPGMVNRVRAEKN